MGDGVIIKPDCIPQVAWDRVVLRLERSLMLVERVE
jgi:hypothetical protein